MVAEIGKYTKLAVRNEALQWGRDQLVAEILPARRGADLFNRSFNGAATNWSRKCREPMRRR